MRVWTIGALKVYVDRIVADHVAVHRAERRAVTYARRGIERRLAGLASNIREASRRELNYMTRVDYDAHHTELLNRHIADFEKLDARLDIVEKWKATVAGRTVAILFVVGLFSGVLGVLIGHIFFG